MIATDEDHAMGVCGNVMVCRWRGRTHAAAVRSLHPTLRELCSTYTAIGIMHVIEPHAIPPDAEARAAVVDLVQAGDPALRGTSIVPEGAGFRAALVRGVVTRVTMLARLPSPMRVFANIDEAIDWHLEHADPTDAAARAALVDLSERLRAALDARA